MMNLLRRMFVSKVPNELPPVEREHKLWALTDQLLALSEEEWERVKRAREEGSRLGVRYPEEVVKSADEEER